MWGLIPAGGGGGAHCGWGGPWHTGAPWSARARAAGTPAGGRRPLPTCPLPRALAMRSNQSQAFQRVPLPASALVQCATRLAFG